jgi:hypothetical protein
VVLDQRSPLPDTVEESEGVDCTLAAVRERAAIVCSYSDRD